jgi:peroxidase
MIKEFYRHRITLRRGIDNHEVVVFTESLAPSFYNTPEIDEANGIHPLLRSLRTDFAQVTDVYAVAALRDVLNAGLVGGGVDLIDLIAIDNQLERDVVSPRSNTHGRALSPFIRNGN